LALVADRVLIFLTGDFEADLEREEVDLAVELFLVFLPVGDLETGLFLFLAEETTGDLDLDESEEEKREGFFFLALDFLIFFFLGLFLLGFNQTIILSRIKSPSSTELNSALFA